MNTQKMRASFERAFTPATSPAGDDPETWLAGKITQLETEAARLEQQLAHIKILLRGHQTWLNDVQRRKAGR